MPTDQAARIAAARACASNSARRSRLASSSSTPPRRFSRRERAAASAEVAAAVGVDDAMDEYVAAMEADFGAQLDAVRSCVLRATERADDLLDATLRLTNGADLFATYVLGNGGGKIRDAYGSRVLGDAEAELRAALAEHTGWLARNNERQLTAYEEAVRSRGFDPALTDLNLGDVIAADGAEEAAEVEAAMAEAAVQTEAEAVRAETVQTETESEADSDEAATPSSPEVRPQLRRPRLPRARAVRKRFSEDVSPLAVAAGFNNAAAARLLEDEVREAVYSTVGAAGAAFFFAVFLSGSWIASRARTCSRFSLTAAVGYVSVLSLPLKRAETKAKVRAAAEEYLGEVEAAMRAEFARKTTAARPQVRATVDAPWVESAARAGGGERRRQSEDARRAQGGSRSATARRAEPLMGHEGFEREGERAYYETTRLHRAHHHESTREKRTRRASKTLLGPDEAGFLGRRFARFVWFLAFASLGGDDRGWAPLRRCLARGEQC